jgi:hypothetical protein
MTPKKILQSLTEADRAEFDAMIDRFIADGTPLEAAMPEMHRLAERLNFPAGPHVQNAGRS